MDYWELLSHHPTLFLPSLLSLDPVQNFSFSQLLFYGVVGV